MSEFKGTKGEWEICEHSWAETSIFGDGHRIALLSIEAEATEDNQSELEARQLADARLFAASKDLLEALQAHVEINKRLMATLGLDEQAISDSTSQARAAIRKALGEDE